MGVEPQRHGKPAGPLSHQRLLPQEPPSTVFGAGLKGTVHPLGLFQQDTALPCFRQWLLMPLPLTLA